MVKTRGEILGHGQRFMFRYIYDICIRVSYRFYGYGGFIDAN